MCGTKIVLCVLLMIPGKREPVSCGRGLMHGFLSVVLDQALVLLCSNGMFSEPPTCSSGPLDDPWHLICDEWVGVGAETRSLGQRVKKGTPHGRSWSILHQFPAKWIQRQRSSFSMTGTWIRCFMSCLLFRRIFSIMCYKNLAESGCPV